MTTTGKVVLYGSIATVAGIAFFVWFRQKDGVSATDVKLLNQYRAVDGSLISSATGPAAAGALFSTEFIAPYQTTLVPV